MKKALVTGITGQDGSYLTEFLLNMLNMLKIISCDVVTLNMLTCDLFCGCYEKAHTGLTRDQRA